MKHIKFSLFTQVVMVVLLGLIFSSCKKTDPLDCLTSTGSDITEQRAVSSFNKIILNDNVNLVITQDSSFSIQVRAGENIIDKVTTNIENQELSIHNHNTCNWVRSFDREIIVYVGVNHLHHIEYRGSGDISSTNVIKGDSLMLEVREGAGKVDLNIDMERNYIYFHIGTADIFYSGYAHISYVSGSSFGPVDARNMETVFTFISNSGSNNCYVRASSRLEATISSIGNIYYFGNPYAVLAGDGEGELIKVDD
ncbi:MAG: hypothetical protein GQ527_04480 [Bacteroidales bacterium]|nr:hypothetical protein [Bacteroidales bacterium]